MCWASKEREALVEGTPHTRDRYGSPSQTSEDADPCESQVVSHFCQHADLAQSFQNLCAEWTKAGGVGRQKRGARFPWNSNPPTRG